MAAKLTDAEVTATVRASGMDEADQDLLLGRALAGDPGARFIVFGMNKRMGKKWDPSVGRYGAWVQA